MSQRTKNTLIPVLIIVVFTLLSPLIGATNISLDFGDDMVTITAPGKFEYLLEYSSIASMELVTLSDPGTATTGSENRNCRWGGWENDVWGEYTLCALKRVDDCLLITLNDGSRLVLNLEDEATTQELYSMFTELLSNKSGT